MCDGMAMDLEGDISCTHCNVQDGMTKRTVHVAFKFPFCSCTQWKATSACKRLVWKLKEKNNIRSIGPDNSKNIKTDLKKIGSKNVG